MVVLTGTIDDIFESTTVKGKKYWRMLVAGVSVFAWTNSALEGFLVGDKVKATATDEDYPKLTKLELLERPKQAAPSTTPANAPQTSVEGHVAAYPSQIERDKAKTEGINRSVALYAAVDLYSKILGGGDDMDIVSDKVVKLAQFFEKYLNS